MYMNENTPRPLQQRCAGLGLSLAALVLLSCCFQKRPLRKKFW
jgi:hypothetical protein